ncbi:threonine--tRNA ligase [Candidatus Liberibacter africanus]|uniref:Threonine--tRNA ligase n=1 Tax=Candidatus Liberibacter africanus PTSAPSY TaxID=1277257 RepID=A0A0G3I3X7_LIBAF|nr:threonine--tRNA ligase [Candidatus Liberibacter africanus]AKK20586.1 threonyl-tRNA synthetase [Candidatus Liberibacter africanus PTSAPSY]QTP64279.1 threonine--tRNA ligase [Candidatus Liberibacter africanus]
MPSDIKLTFPDDSIKIFPSHTTGSDVAESISKSLAKKAIAMAINGKIYDLSDLIQTGSIEIITSEDPRSLDIIRHSCAHIMAEAVQSIWSGIQVAIGPVIENGFYYDFYKEKPFNAAELEQIEKKMHDIIEKDSPFLKQCLSREQAKEIFESKKETYKVEILEKIPAKDNITIYHQGTWFDLCRGPHVRSTGQVKKFFKLMKVAGAYWRGDNTRPMLSRIYGTAWNTQRELTQYLDFLEESEKRDHRKLAREMDLFHISEDGSGVIFWHQKGWKIFQNLISYMRRKIKDDYEEINTPQVLDQNLWQKSGHWDWYRANMFAVKCADDTVKDLRSFALKPMNCPGHVAVFNHGLKSYRELPIRLAEFGSVYRNEPSGALHGLMRVRGFTQDDAHVFCTKEQMFEECLKIHNLIVSIYKDFGFETITVKLSTRPEKRVGSDELWDDAENIMNDVLDAIKTSSKNKINTGILLGEGAFYGPKFEYILKDAIGRDWQCGTIQIDFNLPSRFNAFYINSQSEKCHPVMIHRAIFGSIERFIGIMIENFKGNLPLWLSPVQAIVTTITSSAVEYAQEVTNILKSHNLSIETDFRNEKISYKIREHSVKKIPIIIICGDKEATERSVVIRRLGSTATQKLPLSDAIPILTQESLPPDFR